MASLKLEWTDVMNQHQNRGGRKERKKQCLWSSEIKKSGRKSRMKQRTEKETVNIYIYINVTYYFMIKLDISMYYMTCRIQFDSIVAGLF